VKVGVRDWNTGNRVFTLSLLVALLVNQIQVHNLFSFLMVTSMMESGFFTLKGINIFPLLHWHGHSSWHIS